MIKKSFVYLVLMAFVSTCSFVFAEPKVAVVDLQKVVNNSTQIKSLKKEQEAKKKELIQFIQKANEEIKKQPDVEKKEALVKKYKKEVETKTETNAKLYKTKFDAADKHITDVIAQQAKSLGYDMVFAKGVVLFGGDDITEAVVKAVK